MIGNDIVDLALAHQESKWGRKGFLHKIFTPHEQQLIRTTPAPDQMVWLLWTMKESAYKIAVRAGGKRHFAPTKLECKFTELDHKGAKGIVSYVGEQYLTKSSFTTQYIATVSINRKGILNCRTGIFPVEAGCRNNSCLFPEKQMDASLFHSTFDHIIVSLSEITYQKQHQHLWIKIQQHCAAALWVPEKEIHFHKDETGAPWLSLSSAERIPLSVSHHGRFGAFVISPH